MPIRSRLAGKPHDLKELREEVSAEVPPRIPYLVLARGRELADRSPLQVRSMLLTPSRKPAPRIGDSRQPQKTRLRKESVSDDQRPGSLCTLFHDLQRVAAMKQNRRHDGDIERAQPIR